MRGAVWMKLLPMPSRISPKRFGSVIYENRDLLNRNRELIKLDDTIHNGGIAPEEPNVDGINQILYAMEMTKSLDEVRKRYSEN